MSIRKTLPIVLLFTMIAAPALFGNAGKKHVLEVGISPSLPPQTVAPYFAATMDLLKEKLCGEGDIMHVTNSLTLERIATIELNSKFAGKNCDPNTNKWKGQLYAQEVNQIAMFFKRIKAKEDPEAIGELGIFSFLNLVSHRSVQYRGDYRIDVVLMGNAIHIDPKGTGFSTLEAYPSDGVLLDQRSPFTVRGREKDLDGIYVHLIHPPLAFYNDIHREALKRFLALAVSMQSGQLISFSEDTRIVPRLVSPPLPPITAEFNQRDQKPVFYSVRRRRNDLWADLPEHTPPSTDSIGALVVGIRWGSMCPGCDYDLYCALDKGGMELSYKRPAAEWGIHVKDFTQGSSEEYESIEFHRPVDLMNQPFCAVNLYKGTLARAIRGEVRVIFGGQLYGSHFFIPALRGNGGATGASQNEFWTELNLPEIVGLAK